MIPYGRQHITQADIDAVETVLRGDFITQGPAIGQFEQAVTQHCGARYAVAVNSATSALHIACDALGLGNGDWLWTSPITFVASANCALYCQAQVDFVDINPRTLNIDIAALRTKLIAAKRDGKLPKILIPVHFAGTSCDMQAISQLSSEFGFRVIEDASHAIGASYQDAPVGNCRYSDICVFSFHPVKIVTSGEGGMAVTNDDELAATMLRTRTHGITRDDALMSIESHGPWYYEQTGLGWNYRMTDIHAALGASQMTRLTDYINARQDLAARYDQLLANLPVITPIRPTDGISALHLYPVQIEPDKTGRNRRQVFEAMRRAGIGVNVHYIPVHLQPYYQAMGFRSGDFPHAEHYYAQAISLPMFATLTEGDQNEVVAALTQALSA